MYGEFKDKAEEALYQEYIRSQKLCIIPAFVYTAVIYLVCSLALDLSVLSLRGNLTRIIANAVFIAFTLLVLVVLKYLKGSRGMISFLCVLLLWGLVSTALLFGVGVRTSAKVASGTVGWIQVEIFTSFVVLPWRLRWVLGTSLLVVLVYTVEQAVLWLSLIHI